MIILLKAKICVCVPAPVFMSHKFILLYINVAASRLQGGVCEASALDPSDPPPPKKMTEFPR